MAVTVTHATVTAVPDDPAYDIGSDEWNANHTVTNALDKTGDTMTGALAIGNGTLTASAPALDISQTWNSGAVVFNATSIAVTDTASNVTSTLANWTVGGTTKFGVTKDGVIFSLTADADLFSGRAAWNSYTRVYDGILAMGSPSANSVLFEFAAQNKAVFMNTALVGWSSTGLATCVNLRAGLDTAFYRNGAGVVEVNTGTAGTFGDMMVRTVITNPVTVANLPTGVKGMRAFVTDATQTMTAGIGAVVAGTGANNVPVYYDGTNWRIG